MATPSRRALLGSLLLVLAGGLACSPTKAARHRLEAMGVPYTEEAFYASVKGDRAAEAELFLAAGMGENRSACTVALCVAARQAQAPLVKMLAAAGADVNSRSGSLEGYTVLMLATEAGGTQAVKELLAAGADVNARAGVVGHTVTALHLAASRGDGATAQALLSSGADVNEKAAWLGDIVTALHLAAGRGDAETVRVLAKGGADVNAASQKGVTPLQVANEGGKEETAALLRELGARG